MSGSEDGKVWLWDLQTREVVQVLEGHGGKSLIFSCLCGGPLMIA